MSATYKLPINFYLMKLEGPEYLPTLGFSIHLVDDRPFATQYMFSQPLSFDMLLMI